MLGVAKATSHADVETWGDDLLLLARMWTSARSGATSLRAIAPPFSAGDFERADRAARVLASFEALLPSVTP